MDELTPKLDVWFSKPQSSTKSVIRKSTAEKLVNEAFSCQEYILGWGRG